MTLLTCQGEHLPTSQGEHARTGGSSQAALAPGGRPTSVAGPAAGAHVASRPVRPQRRPADGAPSVNRMEAVVTQKAAPAAPPAGTTARWLRRTFALLAAALPIRAAAQTEAVVRGMVIAPGESPAVAGATVDLEGHGVTQTTAAGFFRFERVAIGEYSLKVTAVGFQPAVLRLTVEGDTTVTVRLERVPFRLDSLVVTARKIDVEGRVQDPGRDLPLRDADVLTSHGPPMRTDRRGRFRLKEVWEGGQIALSVSAFGYLPLDTTVVPLAGDRYVFDLVPDLLVERMIAQQIERIEQRAGGRLSTLMRPLDRDGLLRSGGGSLRDVLRAKYSIHLRRLRCVLVDDRLLPPSADGAMLGAMIPEDVQRVEFLFNGAMLRVYTRQYMRRLIGSRAKLRPPVYVAIANPPVCE